MDAFSTLQDQVTKLGISRPLLQALLDQKIVSVFDLLHWYPRRWEDRTNFDLWPQATAEKPICLRAKVVDQKNMRFGNKRHIFEATLEPCNSDEVGFMRPSLVARWFQLPWMSKKLPVGTELVLWGKPKQQEARVVIDFPEFETIAGDVNAKTSVHLGRIVPVYPLAGNLQQRPLRTLIAHALENVESSSLPPLSKENCVFSHRLAALQALHFPESEEQREQARVCLALEEFVVLQTKVLQRKSFAKKMSSPARAAEQKSPLLQELLALLSFKPTQAQLRSLQEIQQDLALPVPMTRLLQGDVGSGKTLVAAGAAAFVLEQGWQVAVLAPTQILAEQHFATFAKWFGALGIPVSLHTSARQLRIEVAENHFTAMASRVDSSVDLGGDVGVFIGTHALFEEKISMPHLGLVIVDEQHKFGVNQREQLLRRGDMPDLLVMTATPIPRTLCLTHYGDLDLSVLEEKPANRGKVVTRVRPPSKWREATAFLREKLTEGRQAYLVYPLVEESDSIKASSAEGEFERWQKRLKGFSVGLLHGRMSAEEKEQIMEQFRQGNIRVLVTTTVVEVGVDVANATLLYVWNAERFGLAQLHQLRGRIGRSENTGYCVLFSDPKKYAEAQEKLAVLEQTNDGFALAEADMALRGPGELLGTAQSGATAELRLGNLITDEALVRQAAEIAENLLKDENSLE